MANEHYSGEGTDELQRWPGGSPQMPPELSIFKHIEYYSVSAVASSEAEPMDHEHARDLRARGHLSSP